jgi:two-component system chemotaxis response regulator CheY
MRILIAEDDPFSRKILRLILESENRYEIVTAEDGNQAWAEIERGAGFALCILDIMMPGIDGLKLTARLRADPRFREQRVMLCTALYERAVISQAAMLGVSHYIVKPYAKDTVLKQVRRICEEAAAAAHFEEIAQVSARLGIGQSQVATFLRDLHRDVALFTAACRTDPKHSLLRLNALKGAAINLGVRTMAGQLAALEEGGLAEENGPNLADHITAVEAENERLRRFAGVEEAVPAGA